MTKQADVVVVGAGAFGASVAFHLVASGRRVVVVDRSTPVSQTSARGAGLWQKVRHDETTSRLISRSIDKVIAFREETGEALAYHRVGSLKFARTPEAAEQLKLEVARGRNWGIDIELIDRAEARRLAPYADPDRALALSWAPADIYLEAEDLPNAYLRAAVARGAELLAETTVTEVVVRDGEIRGVMTDKGAVDAPVVVNAAGAWAPTVAAMAGVHLCAVPVRHQLLITGEASIPADLPIVRILDAHVYARPAKGGGLMFGGFESEGVSIDPTDLAAGIETMPLDQSPLRGLADDVLPEYPALRDRPIKELRGGLPTMTPDGYHIFGEADGVRGFWIMSGCLVGGHSISPGIGEAMANWIVDGDPGYDMTRFGVARFGAEFDDPKELRRVGLWRYGRHYVTPETVQVSR
jgi:glycine/D-amino acid oxidase-like deaminating enzyme